MRKPLIPAIFLAILAIYPGLLQAATHSPVPCTDYHVRYGAFHYQRLSGSDGSCILSIDPFDIHHFLYRGYLVSNEGLLMVFNSYSDGSDATSTGARVFHFFPRQNTPDLVVLDKEIHVKFASPKMELVLSQEKDEILRLIGGQIHEARKVQPTNQGGVEIIKSQALYLDSGFAMGHDVTTDLQKNSVFHDSKGHTCTVSNADIFSVASDGDSHFKFSDSGLKTFLKSRCPRLIPGF
jgi:hypothetical protein